MTRTTVSEGRGDFTLSDERDRHFIAQSLRDAGPIIVHGHPNVIVIVRELEQELALSVLCGVSTPPLDEG